ncbi:predicted protein [Histoplasma capsulatum G186AR]|uniref:Uncharacterized protein n=1 Tax=Ajellomyces capsulatus (strain G186AR / H82 / ATCC MYA-2454 / RMSCC 2432) TaxID=447093 RepID=C0NMY1_AJECG|nr:uncharacterized protein HCBG_04108 [Histoplasma capsulatum G186AR]EEH07229.1 predicted protein [Histoplasma capsulatum G186AR]
MYRVVCSAEAREMWCCNAYAAKGKRDSPKSECRIAHQVKTRQNKTKQGKGRWHTNHKEEAFIEKSTATMTTTKIRGFPADKRARAEVIASPSAATHRGTTGDGHAQIALLVINTGDLPSCQLN